jgi:hypothetical protein
MIRSLHKVFRLAKEKYPRMLAVLRAVKGGWERIYIEPVLSGRPGKMKKIAV